MLLWRSYDSIALPSLSEITWCREGTVDMAKVRDYLLSVEHPVGRFKAVFFSELGYSRSRWPKLLADLETLAREEEATPGATSKYGQKFEIRSILKGPSGREATIISVWMVRIDENFPRFITAFPGE